MEAFYSFFLHWKIGHLEQNAKLYSPKVIKIVLVK